MDLKSKTVGGDGYMVREAKLQQMSSRSYCRQTQSIIFGVLTMHLLVIRYHIDLGTPDICLDYEVYINF